MISQTLEEAREYEETAERDIADSDRPAFHLSARTGWMNDPNGFSWHDGKYHLFYQYYPYDTHWSFMHWGHAVSGDLLHWEYLPMALAPDEMYDRDGCYSGSAVTLASGRHLLLYTGVAREKQKDGRVRDEQNQCVAVGDGRNYEKYAKNPVIDASALPEGFSRQDFRDPKIWRREDGTYRCVVGNRTEDGDGQILLFSGPDGFNWEYEKVLVSNRGRFGRMWECPDFFQLDGKAVLLVSPQEMLPQGLEFHNGSGTLCIIGNFEEESESFTEEHCQSVDYGIDFYAPQTLSAPDGRRIMIGWMQNWDTCEYRGQNMLWFGQMSLPRELSVKNGRLYQWPVRELETMRRDPVSYRNISVSEKVCLEGISGRRADIELTLRPREGQDLYREFVMNFAENDKYYTSLSFEPRKSVLKIDRKFSGSRKATIHQRRCHVNSTGGNLELRVVLDRFSAEIFAGGGEQVMTITFYTEQAADGISFQADGIAEMDVAKYSLS